MIAKGNKILLDRGYGWADLKKTKPVKNDTKFYIASITKQFTSSAILKLEEQGKLRTTDSITKFFKGVPPNKGSITIQHLLTQPLSGRAHSEGVQNLTDPAHSSLIWRGVK